MSEADSDMKWVEGTVSEVRDGSWSVYDRHLKRHLAVESSSTTESAATCMKIGDSVMVLGVRKLAWDEDSPIIARNVVRMPSAGVVSSPSDPDQEAGGDDNSGSLMIWETLSEEPILLTLLAQMFSPVMKPEKFDACIADLTTRGMIKNVDGRVSRV